jgi:hypothetical protein
MFAWQITNLDEVRKGHAEVIQQTERLVVSELDRAGRFAESHVRRFSTFKRRTGATQAATKHRVLRSGGKLIIFNTKKHAAALDRGAHPHLIVARRRKALAFRGADGRMIFRRVVRHPGNRPYKFLYNATNAAYRVLGSNLERGMAAIARRF